MSPRSRPPRWTGLLRILAVLLAFGLGILAVYLVAIGKSDKQHQLGIIAGLWSALVGAYGIRHPVAVLTPVYAPPPPPAAELEVRESAGIETQREVAARRAYEQQLHALVRREMEHIQNSVGEQVAQLRADVATLRGDLLEKLGGQIRLERIETTRLIGSEVEALSHEVRQLAVARGVLVPADIMDFGRHDGGADRGIAPQLLAPLGGSPRLESASERTDVHPPVRDEVPAAAQAHAGHGTTAHVGPPPASTVQAVTAQAPTGQAQTAQAPTAQASTVHVATAQAPAAQSSMSQSSTSQAPTAQAPAAQDRQSAAAPAPHAVHAPAAQAQPEPATPPTAPPTPADDASDGPAPSMGRDPFAGLPRLSRFAEADLGPLPTSKAAAEPVRVRGHHQAPDEVESEPAGGGRRRRADGETNDILARLLNSR